MTETNTEARERFLRMLAETKPTTLWAEPPKNTESAVMLDPKRGWIFKVLKAGLVAAALLIPDHSQAMVLDPWGRPLPCYFNCPPGYVRPRYVPYVPGINAPVLLPIPRIPFAPNIGTPPLLLPLVPLPPPTLMPPPEYGYGPPPEEFPIK